MMLTFEKLIPGYDAANQTTFINVMEGIALSPGMDNLPEWDTHILNQEMIEALKVYCANEADKTKTNILSGVAEKYKRPLKILGNSMQNTGYSLMLYSISAGYWKNAIVYGGNGANAFNIVAGNTLTTDLVTLDSVTEIALQNAMLNSTAVLTAAGSAEVLNNNLALSVLQNDIAGLNEYTKNALKGGSKADLGNKLDYLFGEASGNKHNIERSRAMQEELRKIGIHNTPSGREYISNHLNDVLKDSSNISNVEVRSYIAKELPGKPIVEYTAITRESLLMGPGGAVKVESVWDGNRLITVIVKGGN